MEIYWLLDVRLSASFWRGCTELRNVKIGKWMLEQGLAPWPKGDPPKLKLEPIGNRRFRLVACNFPTICKRGRN